MSRSKNKSSDLKGLIKGTPTAVLVSAAIHFLVILVAGSLVIFTIIDRKEQKFAPVEKIERPKMKLKKLRVKVKENSRPKRTTQRIVSKTRQAMPDIQLPEMSGVGGSLADGIGGFEMMADMSKMTLMGSGQSIGNDLVGTFYDLKRLRSGADNPDINGTADHDDVVQRFIKEFSRTWDVSMFDKYYRAPTHLYATQFMVPPCPSRVGPSKFGIGDDMIANYWVIIYSGKIGNNDGGRFRFWGVGDDAFLIRINGKLVFDGSWGPVSARNYSDYVTPADENRVYECGNAHYRVGEWFELEPGEPVDMDLLISEVPGGTFSMMLFVQQEGVEYAETDDGAPILPIFKTMPTPPHLIDEIKYGTIPGRYDLEGGPLFGIY
jgi:hypothetical protein